MREYEDNSIVIINNLDSFKEDIELQVLEDINKKILNNFGRTVSSVFINEMLINCIDEGILNYEFGRFIIIDAYNNNKGYINRNDISKLIISISNELICKRLNRLVDERKIDMLWDKENCQFLWQPILGEKNDD